MSTRCNIEVNDKDEKKYECMIYVHCDGYPEGILPFLEDFTKKFYKDRKDDCEYFLAQYLIQRAIADYKEKKDYDYVSPENKYTGYGVCTKCHGDIEFSGET